MNVNFVDNNTVIQLADDVKLIADRYASPMMDVTELLYLAATLKSFAWKNEAYVCEIGAYHGNTTVFMASVLDLIGQPNVKIVSIDPFERVQADPLNPAGSYTMYLQNIIQGGVSSRCVPVVAFSQDAVSVLHEGIGVLIVDGCHHYEFVLRDLQLYAHKLLAGGLVFIDDYGEAYPGVIRAADEMLTKENGFEVLHRCSWFLVARKIAFEVLR